MLEAQKRAIDELRSKGLSFAKIGTELGLSVNTVKSYCHRSEVKKRYCKQCGGLLIQQAGRRKKTFCSDNCRSKWWNNHHTELDSRVLHKLTCANTDCGEKFVHYGNQQRKYYCHACYIEHRFGHCGKQSGVP